MWKKLKYFLLLLPLSSKTRSAPRLLGEQPSVVKELVKDYFKKLNVLKSMVADLMYPRVLMDLADVISEALAIIFENCFTIGGCPG